MTAPLNIVRDRYEAIRGSLDAIAVDLKAVLADFCRQLRIYAPRIEGRTKETRSLLLKIVRKEREGRTFGDPLVEIGDKVGVRADLVYFNDVDRLVERISQASDIFEQISEDDIEDKRLSLQIDRVGYIGVHISVTPRKRRGLDASMARCEIQIRTNAQAAWAMASHDLVYKPMVPLSGLDTRRVYRLTALMELFDEQVGQARSAALSSRDYPLAVIVSALENVRFEFVNTEYDKQLTADILRALEGDITAESAFRLSHDIEDFSRTNALDLGRLLVGSYPLLTSQPEAILIYMRLEADRFSLEQQWIDAGLPRSLLVDMADAWGKPLPEPI